MEILILILVVIVFMAMAFIILRLKHERNAYRKQLSQKNKTTEAAEEEVTKKRIEFSKAILLVVMLTYFVAVGIGVWLSLVDPMQYSTLAMLVGAPTAVAIGFYAWKAKAENVLKIRKENPQETEGTPFDPGSIT